MTSKGLFFVDRFSKVHINVELGDGAYIGPFCNIGDDPEIKDRTKYEFNQGVRIGDRTKITGSTTIDGGSEQPTKIGVDCYIMKQVHIGHDVIIGDNVVISPHATIGGHVMIGHNVNIGMGAIIHQRCEIPQGCMIGMGAVITKKTKLEPYGVYVGNPARYLKENTRAK